MMPSAPLQWFAVATFISLASYVLLILSANVKLTNGFKGLVYNLNRLMKQRISQDRNNNNKEATILELFTWIKSRVELVQLSL